MKLLKRNPASKRIIKAAVNKYKLKIKETRAKLVNAMRKYKQAVEKERIAAAEKMKNR